MIRNTDISNRVRNLIIAFLILTNGLVCIYILATTRAWINRPFPGFLVLNNRLVAVLWMPEWAGFQKGIRFGDIITSVNGQPVTTGDQIYQLASSAKPGAPFTYSFLRGGEPQTLTIPVSTFTGRDYFFMIIFLMLIGGLACGTGLAVFYLKPNLTAARVFLLINMDWGITMLASPEYCTNHTIVLPQITFLLVGPCFLLLGLYFPELYPRRKMALGITAAITAPLMVGYIVLFYQVDVWRYLDIAFNAQLVITTTIGVFIMARTFSTSTDPLTRQRAKMVIYGTLIAFLGGAMLIIGSFILKTMSVIWGIMFLVMIPFSLGYAIVMQNLFDVDVFIRRSISYVVVSGITLILFLAFISVFSFAFQNLSGQSSQIVTIISTLLILALMRPVYSRIENLIDRRFYREKHEYSLTIQKAAGLFASIIELEQLLDQVLQTIAHAINIERGVLLLRRDLPDRFDVMVAQGYPKPYTFTGLKADNRLVRFLEQEHRAFQRNDVLELKQFGEKRTNTFKALNALGLVLVVPIIYEQRLIGILALGEKKNGAWYSSEDIALLQTLMLQTSVSIENARKVEELKKMVELEASYRELQEIDRMKDNLLHMVSHDLRTPMTGILGYAELLYDGMESYSRDQNREYLGIIIRESERMTRLINDLLDLQRFESGRITLDLIELDLVALVRESSEIFKSAADQRHLEMVFHFNRPEVKVKGDWDRLRQVVANLLSNAVKFTPEGGRITTTVDIVHRNGGPALARVEVADTGQGIPEELQPRLFNKFQQAHQGLRSKNEGSGLGLALAREIIQYHQGEVGVESRPGQGSRFFFCLNAVGEEEPRK